MAWSEPAGIGGASQARGNSGFLPMGLYEIQVLDGCRNPTYADAQAGDLWTMAPAGKCFRKAGEWQVYDIVFEAPRLHDGKLVKPAYQTVFWNGVVVHLHKELLGPMVYRQLARHTPHDAELPPGAPGSPQSGPIPEYLGVAADGLRSA